MEKQILELIVKLGGKILSEDEFYFPHNEYTMFHYEDCPETNDWFCYPIENPDMDMSLLIVTEDMLETLEETLIKYFEIENDDI